MRMNPLSPRTAAALLVGALALTACEDSPVSNPSPPAALGVTNVGLEISSLSARVGDRVAIALRADGGAARSLGAAQGRLFFDAAKLRYVGQDAGDFVLVNDSREASGELRFVATDVDGFGARIATLVFEVKSGGYDAGLRYSHEELGTIDHELVEPRLVSAIRVAPDLAARTADAQQLSVTDWLIRLDDRPGGAKTDVNLRPGEYRLNLVYGDARLNGGVNSDDALAVAQVAVGLREMIVGSESPDIDVVVAGNIIPFNLPDRGQASDAIPPGLNPDGTRTLTSQDVLAIRQEAVGINPAIAGEFVPGREALPTNRISVPAGDITTNTTWTADNIYELQGIVRVTGGATLTINAGTRVESVGLQSGGILGALFIARDGRIAANGTALQPIVFTCAGVEPKPKGCWGGVWVAGNARLNEGDAALGASPAVPGRSDPGGCNQKAGEATTPQLLYGGCNDADNSGILRYVIIEYAGWTFQPNVELNGLTLGGVGSGTQIDHIQVHAGQDDGVELFGGTVNLKHIYLTANSDDSFDISFGWSGAAQFVVIQHDPNDADKGLEADNTETAATFGNTPRTNGQIWNVTFIGATTGSNPTNPANISQDAIHVRRGTGPLLSNWLIANARLGVDLDDPVATCVAINDATRPAGGLVLRNSIFANAADLGNGDADAACGGYAAGNENEEAWINDAVNSNSVSASTAADIFISAQNVQLADFRPKAGQAGGGATPSGPFLDASATYVGAVAPSNSTKSNVPWYSGWTRGWFSATQP